MQLFTSFAVLTTAEEVERIKRTVENWNLDFEVLYGGVLLRADVVHVSGSRLPGGIVAHTQPDL